MKLKSGTYLILKEIPNGFTHIMPGRVWDGNNGMMYIERDLISLIKSHPVTTRKTKYGMSYYFETLPLYSEQARFAY